jgi:hypothetical protein
VKAEEVMHEVRDEVISLQERMQKKRWPKVALVGLGGVIGAVLATAAVVVSWGSALAMGLGVGAGALQVSAAGNSTLELMKLPRHDKHAPRLCCLGRTPLTE